MKKINLLYEGFVLCLKRGEYTEAVSKLQYLKKMGKEKRLAVHGNCFESYMKAVEQNHV